MANRC